ncbi:MAG: hypothetical protein JW982_11265 [Spirochaetes bacterium]|nr:hypothetical protein [Spirochaetota bacterium]
MKGLSDTFRLALFTVFESPGYRQVINFIRITGFFNALRQKSGWGKMQRKGFRKS